MVRMYDSERLEFCPGGVFHIIIPVVEGLYLSSCDRLLFSMSSLIARS